MNPTERAVRAFLGSKNVSLWQSWELTNPDSFNQAVTWLTTQVDAVNAISGVGTTDASAVVKDSFSFIDTRRNLPA
jgi:hypothetical protein